MNAPEHDAPWLVACLCAAWCGLCGEYRPGFDALAREFDALRFVWVDIEDEAEALGDIDVVDFPTLLIAQGGRVLYFGPVLPHLQVARQLLQRALAGGLPALRERSLSDLAARLAALG